MISRTEYSAGALQRIVILFALFTFLLLSCKHKKSEETPLINAGTNEFQPNSQSNYFRDSGLILPGGFSALVVADSLGPSRHLAVNSNGDIYVKLKDPKEASGLGSVALRDTNGDGRADSIVRFGSYVNDGAFATEMRIHNGYLYFSSELTVYRQQLEPGKLVPQTPEERMVIDPYPIRWHNAKVLAFDTTGGMYVTFSAPTNACEDAQRTQTEGNGVVMGENPCSQLDILGGVWRFDANKPEQQLGDGVRLATGIRSLVGMTWNPQTNTLFAVNHGRDYLYNHAPMHFRPWHDAVLPAEEFIEIKEGKNYGWPYTYYDPYKSKRMLAPEYGGDGKKTAGPGYENPLMAFPAHWAPNDLLFYQGTQFPERYRNGAFIAFHGSMNRNPYPQSGYVVAFVPFKNGKPSGTWEVFADGFAQSELLKTHIDAKFRPMGLAEGPDGSLYVVDSVIGRLWRITYPDANRSFEAADLQELEHRKKTVSYLRDPDENADILMQ